MSYDVLTKRRLWSKIDVRGGDDCWEWQGLRTPKGYGIMSVKGKNRKAHRLVANAPPDLIVMHTCDNPPCCNPAHLMIGTHYDNVMDKVKKGRCRKS